MFAGMSLVACSENASTTPNVEASSVSVVAPAADTVVVSAPVASEPAAVVSNQTASASK